MLAKQTYSVAPPLERGHMQHLYVLLFVHCPTATLGLPVPYTFNALGALTTCPLSQPDLNKGVTPTYLRSTFCNMFVDTRLALYTLCLPSHTIYSHALLSEQTPFVCQDNKVGTNAARLAHVLRVQCVGTTCSNSVVGDQPQMFFDAHTCRSCVSNTDTFVLPT
jgi:hypothetical protein